MHCSHCCQTDLFYLSYSSGSKRAVSIWNWGESTHVSIKKRKWACRQGDLFMQNVLLTGLKKRDLELFSVNPDQHHRLLCPEHVRKRLEASEEGPSRNEDGVIIKRVFSFFYEYYLLSRYSVAAIHCYGFPVLKLRDEQLCNTLIWSDEHRGGFNDSSF